MPLTYRCLLMPTAALDTAGNARGDVVFTVTPSAGGSAVAVYAAASGGSALATEDVKTDTLGNISGFYVTDAGSYTLTFVGGGTVVTAAIVDARDIALSPVYASTMVNSFEEWTVTPGGASHVGSARFGWVGANNPVVTPGTAGSGGDEIALIPWTVNEDVATQEVDGIHVATGGLYLFTIDVTLMPVVEPTPGDLERWIWVGLSGAYGLPQTNLYSVLPEFTWTTQPLFLTITATTYVNPDRALVLIFSTTDFAWNAHSQLTIVKLD